MLFIKAKAGYIFQVKTMQCLFMYKKKCLSGLFIFYFSIFGGITSASEDAGQYIMAKAGIFDLDVNDSDPLLSIGVLYGYGLTRYFSLESEVNASIFGGNYELDFEKGDFSVVSLGLLAVYRYHFYKFFYAKGKAGIIYRYLNKTVGDDGESFHYGGPSVGIGLGMLGNNSITLELEFNVLELDLFHYNVGVHYPF